MLPTCLRPLSVALGAALCASALPASAQNAASPDPGRLIASNCYQCHGTDGRGPGFERLASRSERELVSELKEMQREGGRSIMARHAWGYTDAQLQALASWLSRQPR